MNSDQGIVGYSAMEPDWSSEVGLWEVNCAHLKHQRDAKPLFWPSIPPLEALADAARLSHNNTKTIALRGYVFAQTGRVAEAREILQVLEALSRERFLAPYCIALVHLGLEEYEPALDALERGYAARDTHLIFLPIDAKWDTLRHHERFRALLRRCGFAT